MAPMKLEDNMKERLEERRIAPTGAAWDRISSKLDSEKGRKKNTIVLWSAIAASFVGGALITLFVLNNDAPSENSNFVENPKEEIIKSEERIKPKIEDILNDSRNVEVVQVDKTNQLVTDPSSSNKTSQVDTLQKGKTNTAIVENKPNRLTKQKAQSITYENEAATVAENVKSKGVQKSLISEDIIEDKLKQTISQKDLTSVADTEVNTLLKNAQREIASKRIFDIESNRMDANALLLDVEVEVDPETFKDKVFGILKEGFYTARDAVVDRNN